jgi:hypothetical protein
MRTPRSPGHRLRVLLAVLLLAEFVVVGFMGLLIFAWSIKGLEDRNMERAVAVVRQLQRSGEIELPSEKSLLSAVVPIKEAAKQEGILYANIGLVAAGTGMGFTVLAGAVLVAERIVRARGG